MRRIGIGITLALLLVMARETWLLPSGTLQVHLLDVGQGDGILIQTPRGARIVVDGGPDLSLLSVLRKHTPLLNRHIDLVVLTHPDSDHITALPEVLRRYDVSYLLVSGLPSGSKRLDELLVVAAERGTQILVPHPKLDLTFSDDVTLDVIWPHNAGAATNLSRNDASIVFRLLYKEHSLLFAGDIEEVAEAAILRSGSRLAANTLKVAHHGSKTSSSTGFLLAVRPTLGLISAGRGNHFGHPHTKVVERLHQLGINTKNTATNGSVSLEFY